MKDISLCLQTYKHMLRKRRFRQFGRQLSHDIRSSLFGNVCPLCGCKDLDELVDCPYIDLPFEVCQGCRIDLSVPISEDDPILDRLRKKAGLSDSSIREALAITSVRQR